MKNIFYFFVVLNFISKAQSTIVWNGLGVTNNFSEGANWVGGLVPTTGDDVVFNGTSSKNCDLDVDLDVNSFSMNAGYLGVVDALNSSPAIPGVFSIASGTFVSTDQTLLLGGDLITTGGTFLHNNGVVEFSVFGGMTLNISGVFSFNDLRITSITFPSSAGLRTMNFGTGTTANRINLDGAGRLYAYQGIIRTNTLVINGSNINSPGPTNTATFVLIGTPNIQGAAAAGRNQLANITFSTTFVPLMSNHISVTGTWNNFRSGNLAAGGTSTVNFYGSNCAIITHTAAPATINRRAKFHNLTVHSGATLTMGNRHWIEVSKNLTINGTFNTTSQSGIHFDGPNNTTQNLSGTASGFTIGSVLKSNNTSTVSLGMNLTVMDSVKFVSNATVSNGKINTNSFNLILPSNGSLKARISTVGNGTIAVVNNIIGNIRVQTFAPGGFTGWANLGVSGVQGQTFNSWYGQIPMAIEGSATGVTSAGGQYFESVIGWNEPDSYGYDTTITVSSPISPGVGFWVYLGNGQTTTTDMSWNVTGSPVQGTISIPLTRSISGANPGYNLIANPYSCPIKWTNVMAIGSNSNNITNSIYIYNPDLGVTSAFNGVSGITTPAASGATNVIPMGQAFYVEANTNTTLVFTERAKCNNNTTNQLLKISEVSTLEPGDTIEPPYVPDTYDIDVYFRLSVTGSFSDYDETVLHFHPNADNYYDKYDAHKLFHTPGYVGYPGIYDKYTTISSYWFGEDYSINTLKASDVSGYQIPLLVKVMQTGNYTITPIELNNLPNGVCATIHDNLLNITHDLFSGPYICNINDTTSTPRFLVSVCPVGTITKINSIDKYKENHIFLNKDINGIYAEFALQQPANAKISVMNILGQKLMDDVKVLAHNQRVYLDINTNDNLIFVTAETETEKVTKKFVLVK